MDIKSIIDSALKVLREGGVILYPTDTIWGLGCDATNPDAVARIFKIKNRPEAKSLVLLAADLDMVARYVKVIPNIAIDLVEVNDRPMTIIYPGAITSDVPDRHYIAHNAVAEDGSVGIRIPMNEFCVELARKLGRPIVSTSANISGEPSPQVYADIPQEIRDAVDYIVPQKLERDATGFASQIIKVEVDGQVQIIRP
ncbi:MAG: threonylcarbamoyl-AMP synthase [Bacteroidales bacterium]|nr:threonylcarbamoyl-AMP synthase [Bacteroidales bacterium]